MVKELKVIYNQIKDYNPNFTINRDALKIISLDLEITYDDKSENYKVIDNNTGKEYFNRITYPDCNGCKFKTAEEVVKFIRTKSTKLTEEIRRIKRLMK
jgi:hypothetical protein